jgi:hypothetical protein
MYIAECNEVAILSHSTVHSKNRLTAPLFHSFHLTKRKEKRRRLPPLYNSG